MPFRAMGVLPDTATDAPLGNQVVVVALSNKWVLKVRMEVEDLMSGGRLFQVLSAAKLKARDAMVFFVLGTASRILSDERNFLTGA